MKKFTNKVVIVTGATRGIGKGIVQAFAAEGASLVVTGRDEPLLKKLVGDIQKQGGCAIYVKADVRNAPEMEAMAKAALAEYGKIDVLCHNAGIYPQARLESMTLDEWKEVIDINLTGTFLSIKACLPAMKAQCGGKIVVTSSISGPQVALPGFSHYTASKGGVMGFVRTAAVELAKYQINVNCVEPGTIEVETVEALGQEHVDNMVRAVPLGRLGRVEEVADAVLFLASNKASYITGQSLIIDGGQTLPETHLAEY